jgi:hypothetical protein
MNHASGIRISEHPFNRKGVFAREIATSSNQNRSPGEGDHHWEQIQRGLPHRREHGLS